MRSLLALLLLAGVASGESLEEICLAFGGYDGNGDGTIEIDSLEASPPLDESSGGRLILVLVEERLHGPLQAALGRYAHDLAADGWKPRVVRAKVYAGERHQDGRTLLAIREFFRRVRAWDPSFAGAVLVGSFPEAFLVRNCNWRRHDEPLVLRQGKPDEKRFDEGAHNLRTVPEDVAHRAEIVLSDLDGRWDEMYHERRQKLATWRGAWPDGVPARGGVTADFEKGSVTYEDFFYVDDGRLHVGQVVDEAGKVVGVDLVPLDDQADRECSPADLAGPNRMAHPDIVVSRIDAHGVALSPRTDVVGEDGKGLLDEEGRPRAVRFAEGAALPHWANDLWAPDPALEIRLLLEFFERNHAYRAGTFADAFRPASIGCDLGGGYDVLLAGSPGWAALPREGFDAGTEASVLDLARWLGRPAVLRTLRAHSHRWGSAFRGADAAALDQAAGGAPWCWTPRGRELVPSLSVANAGGMADFFLYRSLWANGAVPEGASLYLHTGCEAISPPRAQDRPYNHPEYSLRQGAESILFYARGLALVGRSKVFYDEPRGFCEALAEGRSFGEAWARYFEIEGAAAGWDEVGGDIGRKRAYFWSVLGDWTVRLSPPRGTERHGG